MHALASRHQKTKPYTPRHNGKAERYQRILAEEVLYAHTYASGHDRAHAIDVWNIHYDYHRPHTAVGNQPPAAKLRAGVTNVIASGHLGASSTASRSARPWADASELPWAESR